MQKSVECATLCCKSEVMLGKKCYWMVLFLLGTALTFKGIADVFINYYEFEVTTSTDVTTKDSVTFPAISICNLNKYNKIYYTLTNLILLC